MPKGAYTRKQASIEAFWEVTGELLPETLSFDEIRRRSFQLPAELQNRCHERFLFTLHQTHSLEQYPIYS